jgi:hypothetical protein
MLMSQSINDHLASKGGVTPPLPPIYIFMTWRGATISLYVLRNTPARSLRHFCFDFIFADGFKKNAYDTNI